MTALEATTRSFRAKNGIFAGVVTKVTLTEKSHFAAEMNRCEPSDVVVKQAL